MIPQEILGRIDQDLHRYVDELVDFLRIPSVSTYTRNAADIQTAAHWVLNQLKLLGFEVQIIPTERHPVVLANRFLSPDRPTLLIYGHYDVQPPEPLEEWVTPPFDPSVRDGYIYARGATDDKGQFFTYIKAMEAILASEGSLPINVKVLVEGEEEIGSPNLARFMNLHLKDLSADAVAVSDGSQFSHGTPAITYGLRGLCYFQIDVQGPRFDLHSGSFGGLVENPAQALAQILVQLKMSDGKVAIPGFYDGVQDLEAWERAEMAALALNENELKNYLGVEVLRGEPGYTPMERKTARPTLDVNGIWGGFSGEGAKTIIPAKAGAKVSMRLVPNQSQAAVERLFTEFVHSLTPPGVKVSITQLHGADPVLVAKDHPTVQAASRAIHAGFGKTPVFLREGGSIPVVNLFKEMLGLDGILLLGWGCPDDGAHSPNERLSLDAFHKGTRSTAALLYEMVS